MRRERLAVNTATIPGSLEEKARVAAEVGFGAIAPWTRDLAEFPGGPAAARRLFDRRGLAIAEVLVLMEFQCLPPERRRAAAAKAEQYFRVMADAGARTLLACGTTAPGSAADLEAAARDLRDLGDLAARHGMRIAYEFLAWAAWIKDIATGWEVVRRADRDNVGLTVDSFHVFLAGSRLEDLDAIPADRIFLVQLADAPAVPADLIQRSRHHRLFPGDGVLPVGHLVERLEARGYAGLYSLEIFNDDYATRDSAEVGRAAMASLRSLFDGQGEGR